MPELIDNLCKRCWGRGHTAVLKDGVGTVRPLTCTRCNGTGEEPDWFSWPVFIVCVIILVVGLGLIWSIK